MSRRSSGRKAHRWLGGGALAALGVVLLVGRGWLGDAAPPVATRADIEGDARVAELFESRRGGEMVIVAGIIDRVLSDDNDGSRHQRFIVRLSSGHTLLIAHNIDLAERVPLRPGDPVRVRGEYEWNERGGVLHWTHHDPDGRRQGGWIERDGTRYR